MKTLREGIEELKTALKPMTFGEKITHLWMYYKWVLFAVLAVAAGISIVVNAITAKDPLFNGMTMNIVVAEEAKTYLTDDWKAVIGGEEKDWVGLDVMYNTDDAVMMGQDAMSSNLKMSMMISSGQLDYVLLDQQAMGEFVTTGAFCDLREVLTQEQLDLLGKQICYYKDETENTYPIAVDISGWKFTQTNLTYAEKAFIAFPGNTEHTALLSEFLDYIWKWEKP